MATQNNDNTADVVVRGDARSFKQEVNVGKHHVIADEPVTAGGGDAGPDPYEYLLTSLGVCTSMTVGLYARRKQIPLETITVFTAALAHLCKRLRGVRNEGWHAGQNRSRIGTHRPPE